MPHGIVLHSEGVQMCWRRLMPANTQYGRFSLGISVAVLELSGCFKEALVPLILLIFPLNT